MRAGYKQSGFQLRFSPMCWIEVRPEPLLEAADLADRVGGRDAPGVSMASADRSDAVGVDPARRFLPAARAAAGDDHVRGIWQTVEEVLRTRAVKARITLSTGC